MRPKSEGSKDAEKVVERAEAEPGGRTLPKIFVQAMSFGVLRDPVSHHGHRTAAFY